MADKEIYMFEDGYFPANSSDLIDYGPGPGWKMFPNSLSDSDLYDRYSSEGANHKNYKEIGYWNSTDDTDADYKLWNTIDWSLQHRESNGDTTYGRTTPSGDKEKGSFGAKSGCFRYSNPQGLDSNDESSAFFAQLYDDSKHYITLNFCRHSGNFGGDNKGDYKTEAASISSGYTGTWLSHVIGFGFRWSGYGSHNKKECLWPRRVLMHYARDTGGTKNPYDQTGRQIISIELKKKMNFSETLGSGVTEAPGKDRAQYRYTLTEEQFATFKSSFDRSTNEVKDKYRFAGFYIELRGPAAGSANKTMIAKLWQFRPIVSSTGILTDQHNTPKDYIVVPNVNKFQWGHATNTGGTYNNPGPCITN